MNTLLEKGLADWLRPLITATYPDLPVLTGSDDEALPAEADGPYLRVVCEDDYHDIGPLYLPEIRVEIATPMLTGFSIEQHRALAAAVRDVFADDDFSGLSATMTAAAGRTVTGWFRLEQSRDGGGFRRSGWWLDDPLWRVGTIEV